jgi:hypothetical protein
VAKRATCNALITRIIGDSVSVPIGPLPDSQVDDPYNLEPYGDDVEGDSFLMPEADFVDAAGKPMLQQSFTDTLINMMFCSLKVKAMPLLRLCNVLLIQIGK